MENPRKSSRLGVARAAPQNVPEAFKQSRTINILNITLP